MTKQRKQDADPGALAHLWRDIERVGVALSDGQWSSLCDQAQVVRFQRDAVLDQATDIAERWLFICDGVVASRQTHSDGETTIARFFEPGQICANLTSAWKQIYAADDLIAMTEVKAVDIPDPLFRHELLDGDALGRYFRLKAMETLCFDKEVLSAKTRFDTEIRFQFLEQHYTSVLESLRQRDIAAFLGITPQGLSRFKRNRAS
ncbi:MAG: cyclic nucleotide-binding domain-containing protein [Pseudomonadota bacterium]